MSKSDTVTVLQLLHICTLGFGREQASYIGASAHGRRLDQECIKDKGPQLQQQHMPASHTPSALL
jgi:hypothetical protein